jgi:ComF family protein
MGAPSVAHDVMTALRELLGGALDLLYPFECLVCGGGDGPARATALCRSCDAALPRRDPERPPRITAGPLHGHVVACELEPPASDLVYQLKYGGAVAAALPLAALLEEAVRARGLEREVDALVPVPVHWLKARLRGVDHAGALATELGRGLGLPVRRLLRRSRPTVAQGQARSPEERARQVRGAFAVRSPRRVRGRSLALVDDVVTSGATANECARALLAAGACRVVLFAAAGNG